ncbi:MAG: thioredoxin [Bacteroidetes bacterium]|uniref:Thioredoxin family protein n=1 Tax=Phaeocystidibacter marisrubri TaxID=1577780 RepID=A0A6L3ZHH0_9FLAO|nr:thioredoxin family protein [Phaeocystidibacter marisrubri]KAB2817442.1 thioredoxin family protein [Phaeocystidibacter marisrubri]TNE27221.1 MAG: thioredoxin [Bacteroidota bacterium]GGH75335.1 thiol reductase thioredoxin [Phaeocystidibacter marisrubri]
MVHPVDDTTFESKINEGGIVAVKYYADWCGSCKLFAPKFRRISDEDEMSDVTFLDVNAEVSEKARKLAGVDNLPFLAVFKDGELVEGSATSKEEYLRKMIEKAKNA